MASTDTSSVKNSADRVTDVSNEPMRMLTPIRGFEKLPLMSLEDAVKSLTNIVLDVKDMVFTVKKRCLAVPQDGLTIDESAAIMLYTLEWSPHEKSLYLILNRTLRDTNRKNLQPWFPYLKLFIWALSKLPSKKINAFRGVKEDLHEAYVADNTIVWWGFSSCTSRMDILKSKEFIGNDGKRTIFQIECQSGKDIGNHSFHSDEKEILLIAACQFRVIGCSSLANDLYFVQLQEIEPEYCLIDQLPRDSISTAEMNPFAKLPNIRSTTTWSSNPIILVKNLNHPLGLAINKQNGMIFIADSSNNRIVSWQPGQDKIRVVVDNIRSPTDVVLDEDNNSIIVAYGRNVMRHSLTDDRNVYENILDKVDCYGLAMDNEHALYVVDSRKHEVRRYPRGSTSGVVVAGGNGKGSGLNQLNEPYYMAIDKEGSIYVSDCYNHRVVKWNRNATEGIIVAGFEGKGSKNTQLSCPLNIVVDMNNDLYIADQNNHRIVCYRHNEAVGQILIGSPHLKNPYSLAFDHNNDMYVGDYSHRILCFKAN